MATIRKRQFIEAYLYEVQVRRKGMPSLTVSFSSLEEAEEWVKQNEFRVIENPEKYREWIDKNRLEMKRKREELRKR